MLFILRFTDQPDSLHIRERHLAEHVAWLDAHADQVLVAGKLRTDPQAAPVAAQWIVKAPSPEAALALSETVGNGSRIEVLRFRRGALSNLVTSRSPHSGHCTKPRASCA